MTIFSHILAFLIGAPIMCAIAWALGEVAVEFFTPPPPGKGIVYRDTCMTNRITRELLGGDWPLTPRTRLRPESDPESSPETIRQWINTSPDSGDTES